MKVKTLISGSKGNCALIKTNNGNILIDCGSSYGRIKTQLKKAETALTDINYILITHSHTDHISALATMAQKNPHIEVFVHRNGAQELYERTGVCANTFDKEFTLGEITVTSYRCHHDASCCTGFKISDGTDSIVYVTDTGCVDEQLIDFLADASILILESNHDYEMLRNGIYSLPLKKRIASQNGHLSNEQTAYLLSRARLETVNQIILAHLSENNNLPEIAYSSAKAVLEKVGYGEKIRLLVAAQWEICE
ncbi:MAG: MBL fold metallo-hydrolase [Clostridia bacterium]|nr:MBL fold metallo-hydrolase [Clostridia bacterium]